MSDIVTITGVYVGQARDMSSDGTPTAIAKEALRSAVAVSDVGLDGDEQADGDSHGGPERALSHYPAEHYAVWGQHYRGTSDRLGPGALGENISTNGLTERNVRVGDVFRMGTAVVEVSQPRQPCWKISEHLGLPDLAREVAASGRSGWLYRVLETGYVGPGDVVERVQAAEHGITIARMWALHNATHPDLEELEVLAGLDVLADGWRRRLAERLDWLRRHA